MMEGCRFATLVLSLCNNLLKLVLSGFPTQKEMMKKMVLPAEGHHTGKVGQSDQLTSHLCSDNCDEASLGYATQNFEKSICF